MMNTISRGSAGVYRPKRSPVPLGIALTCLTLASCAPASDQDFAAAALAPAQPAAEAQSSAVAVAPGGTMPVTVAALSPPSAIPDGAASTAVGRMTAEQKVRQLAEVVAADLANRCPVADPGDQAAFDKCRGAMFQGARLRQNLAPYTVWGRTHKDPEKTLKETNLTQFGPDALVGLYLPLFMFSGKHAVTYSTAEKLYRIELGARFRNRLQPGQFPYPFWHEDEKWKTYETANAIFLWVDPSKLTVRFVQFTPRGTLHPAPVHTPVAQAPFDGRWMWTDAKGQQQPKVTLFDGLFRADNPHLKRLDVAYRELALSLRDGQCMACHVPNNPNKMKRLVLLQTPAHAASEIKRVMGTVRRGSMPLSEISNAPEPLDPKVKEMLLARGSAFEKAVDAAKTWEAGQAKGGGAPVAGPVPPKRADATGAIR